ncbi:MAG: beta family protein [Rhodomicrobium sp.]
MKPGVRTIYVPALRMKTGELQGLYRLAEDIKRLTLPHLIVPPRAERDDELQGILMDTEGVPGAGIILAKYWQGRRVLLNPQFLFNDFGEARCDIWLPKTFEVARRERVFAVPVASLEDLAGTRAQAFKDTFDSAERPKVALRVKSGELIEAKTGDHIRRTLDRIGIAPEDCAILADFSESDFSQPDLVAGVIEGSMETLEEMGPWNAIIFQGTSYPEFNPADHSGHVLIPRNEWKAWSEGLRYSRNTGDHLIFGDYAADCAKMVFGKSCGRAIRHYRYTNPTDWFVVRGANTGDDKSVMRDVCRRIIASGHFAGRQFSSADDYIYRTAKESGGPGNATTWREINTTHHITRVVRDIGAVKGLQFGDFKVEPAVRQFEMFE